MQNIMAVGEGVATAGVYIVHPPPREIEFIT